MQDPYGFHFDNPFKGEEEKCKGKCCELSVTWKVIRIKFCPLIGNSPLSHVRIYLCPAGSIPHIVQCRRKRGKTDTLARKGQCRCNRERGKKEIPFLLLSQVLKLKRWLTESVCPICILSVYCTLLLPLIIQSFGHCYPVAPDARERARARMAL